MNCWTSNSRITTAAFSPNSQHLAIGGTHTAHTVHTHTLHTLRTHTLHRHTVHTHILYTHTVHTALTHCTVHTLHCTHTAHTHTVHTHTLHTLHAHTVHTVHFAQTATSFRGLGYYFITSKHAPGAILNYEIINFQCLKRLLPAGIDSNLMIMEVAQPMSNPIKILRKLQTSKVIDLKFICSSSNPMNTPNPPS